MKRFTYILTINGMRCGMCESHVNSAIRNNFKVKSVSSSHFDNQSKIIADEKLDEYHLKEVIKSLGYDLIEINVKEEEVKKSWLSSLFKRNK